jgi:ferritin
VISQKVQDAINDQIQAEFYSSYLYLAMSAYCDSANYKGIGHWFRAQAQEETGHAMRFFSFVDDRGGRVVLKAIQLPPVEYPSLLDIFQQTLEHEKAVTARIVALYQLAQAEGDPTTQVALQWFLTEQIEEEASATAIVETLKRIGTSGSGLVMLDHELGERTAGGA